MVVSFQPRPAATVARLVPIDSPLPNGLLLGPSGNERRDGKAVNDDRLTRDHSYDAVECSDFANAVDGPLCREDSHLHSQCSKRGVCSRQFERGAAAVGR